MPKHDPIRLTTTADADRKPVMVELFSIDDKPYMVEARPGVNIALQVVADLEQYGAVVAEMRMLKRAVGDDAFAALANHRDLKRDQLQSISQAMTLLTLGELEDDGTPEPADLPDLVGDGPGNSRDGSASAAPSTAA